MHDNATTHLLSLQRTHSMTKHCLTSFCWQYRRFLCKPV